MTSKTATVDTLAAEVRVLEVGSRQVTLSVNCRLGTESPRYVEPSGRVRPKDGMPHRIYVVGRNTGGKLARSGSPVGDEPIAVRASAIVRIRNKLRPGQEFPADQLEAEKERLQTRAEQWSVLPLIALAAPR